MFKRIAVLLVAAVALIGLAAVPAQAAYSSCPAERICFYWGANGVGSEALGTAYFFNVTLGTAAWKDVYVGEPVRSNARSMYNNKVNTYISKRNWDWGGCSAFAFDKPNLHRGQGYSFNPITTCFRVNWV